MLAFHVNFILYIDKIYIPFRLLREWICRPSCRKDIIIKRQKAVQELVDRIDMIQSARAILSTLPDLERLLSK